MRRSALICIALMAFLPAHGVDVPVPVAFPADRYLAMRAKSPFALATPVVPVVEPQASFAANWFISGIARIGNEEFVTIKARDLSTQFSLYGTEPNQQHGVTLASIEWSDSVGKSTVVLRKGNETAKLEFNEAEIHNAPPGTNKPATPPGQKPPGVNGAVAPNGTPKATPFSPNAVLANSGQRKPVPMPVTPVAPPNRPNPVSNSGPATPPRRVLPIVPPQ